MKANAEQQTKLILARLDAMTKVEVAEIGAETARETAEQKEVTTDA
jgi:hypothetical protein